jgi:hypothetical protein
VNSKVRLETEGWVFISSKDVINEIYGKEEDLEKGQAKERGKGER